MARKLYNLARMSTATTGTGTITLGSNVTAFLSFAGAGVQDGDVVYYGIRDSAHSEWGYGTYTSSGTTLSRNVLKSTNSDNAISLSGSAEVFITGAAEAFPIGRQSIYIPASAMIAAETSGPASATVESSTANGLNYSYLAFDASADEYAHFQIPMPKGWDEGALQAQFHWTSTSTSTGGVTWSLQGAARSNDDAIDGVWGTAVAVDDSNIAAGDMHITAETTSLTLGGTVSEGDVSFFRAFRDVSDGNDTLTADARLIGASLYYNIDTGNDD